MTTRREAHHPDAIGPNTKFFGARSNQSNGPLRVAQLDRMAIFRAEAVLENECGDSERIQPVCHLTALVVDGKQDVPASWCNDHRSTRGARINRRIKRESRVVLVAIA